MFVELTEFGRGKVWINISNVTTIRVATNEVSGEDHTILHTKNSGSVLVLEQPEEILSILIRGGNL